MNIKEFKVLNGVQEHTIFISCISPKSLKQVADIWCLSYSNLYSKPKKNLLEAGLIKQINTPKKIGEKILFQTDFDKFFEYLQTKDELFGSIIPNLRHAYRRAVVIGGKSERTIFDFIPEIFSVNYKPNPKFAFKYFYIFPRLLALIPIGIWRLGGRWSDESKGSLLTLMLITSNMYKDKLASALLSSWFPTLAVKFRDSVDKASKSQVETLENFIRVEADGHPYLKPLMEDFLKRMGYRKKRIPFRGEK